MKVRKSVAWALVCSILSPTGVPLKAACDPPVPPLGGVYTLTAVYSPLFPPACPDATTCIEIRGDSADAGAIEAFGFNITFGGGPITAVTVNPGFAIGGVASFTSIVAPALDSVAAIGFGDVSDPLFPGLDLLAIVCITLDPGFVGPLTVSFGGTLALSGGTVPVDHLVVAGCDVYIDSVPALQITGANFLCPDFIRGDCNNNGVVIGFVGDVVFLLKYLFLNAPVPPCLNACDANNDDALNITDSVYLLNWMFAGGPVPPPPTPVFTFVPPGGPALLSDCGPDTATPVLSCIDSICTP